MTKPVWKEISLRHLSSIPITNGLGLSGEHDEPEWPRYIRTTDIAGPRELRTDTFASQPPDVAAKAMLMAGDLLMTAAGATIGKSVTFPGGRACYAGFLVRFRPKPGVSRRFMGYWMQSQPYWDQISVGAVRSTIDNFSAGRYRRLRVALPTLVEQCAIADFLDRGTAKIDALIEKQTELITRLQERRAAITQRAVTYGLHNREGTELPDNPVGYVPDGWTVQPLRRAMTSLDGRRIPLSAEERGGRSGEFPYYGASGVIDYVDDFLFDEELLLVSEDGANLILRSSPIAFTASGRYWVNNHAHVMRPKVGSPTFWAARVESLDVAPFVTGSAQPKLTQDALGRLLVSWPTDGEELQEIVAYLERETARIGELIAKTERMIELSRERRSALITAAVTGQIDVAGQGDAL
ncbi:type I restriction enzyme S subunit [Yimella lutea]|uniref:Type I restriction enzyme S subunit n=1 Tax=Yimella lutea TaxID=587872 RepID=A0A542EGR7_9MICO|nr:restriction endonuclease subunit S [Yimella lutea]TQJ14531.1 type I restriction enzyme S subunit [Yimella lutea]